jgi:hypothetical protein
MRHDDYGACGLAPPTRRTKPRVTHIGTHASRPRANRDSSMHAEFKGRQETCEGMNRRIRCGVAGVPTFVRRMLRLLRVGTPRRQPQTQSPRPISALQKIAKLLHGNIHHERAPGSCCGTATRGVRRANRFGEWSARKAIRLRLPHDPGQMSYCQAPELAPLAQTFVSVFLGSQWLGERG